MHALQWAALKPPQQLCTSPSASPAPATSRLTSSHPGTAQLCCKEFVAQTCLLLSFTVYKIRLKIDIHL